MNRRMIYLLDTMVVSEHRKQRPAAEVLRFLDKTPASVAAISIVTLAELRLGAENPRIAEHEASALHRWIDNLEQSTFRGLILGVDGDIAKIWGKLSAQRSRPVIDTFLAATAIAHDLTLVTRNERDFADMPVKLLNPWNA